MYQDKLALKLISISKIQSRTLTGYKLETVDLTDPILLPSKRKRVFSVFDHTYRSPFGNYKKLFRVLKDKKNE